MCIVVKYVAKIIRGGSAWCACIIHSNWSFFGLQRIKRDRFEQNYQLLVTIEFESQIRKLWTWFEITVLRSRTIYRGGPNECQWFTELSHVNKTTNTEQSKSHLIAVVVLSYKNRWLKYFLPILAPPNSIILASFRHIKSSGQEFWDQADSFLKVSKGAWSKVSSWGPFCHHCKFDDYERSSWGWWPWCRIFVRPLDLIKMSSKPLHYFKQMKHWTD